MAHERNLTRDEWLARCALCYDMGYVNRPGLLVGLERAADTFDRLVHDETKRILGRIDYDRQHQTAIAMDNIHHMAERAARDSREQFGEDRSAATVTLANDPVLYGAVNVAAILSHPCQQCATDAGAWHTRVGFCTHG